METDPGGEEPGKETWEGQGLGWEGGVGGSVGWQGLMASTKEVIRNKKN